MTNHVHLLATPAKPGALATMMQSLGRRYVRYVNATYKRSGTLWEGRYKAGAVDAEDYLLRVYRYIELNPVRANMVAHPRSYQWSSYAINGGGNIALKHSTKGQARIFLDHNPNSPCPGSAASFVGFSSLGLPRGFASRRCPVIRSIRA